ncbi:MAG: nucleotidyltransferase domain-containing protein [Vicinamibacterales bacterium]|nr:nucleotidyltransferase domain-containing protein [Vicinamibacterales bacterium]
MDHPDLVRVTQEFFEPPPDDVVAVYLFGSVARERARDSSDVDVGLLFRTRPPRTLGGLHLDIRDRLQEHLGRPVDLVILNHAPADLVHRVLRDGILVAETDRAARIAFEVRLRNEYFDLEPARARYRRSAGAGAQAS